MTYCAPELLFYQAQDLGPVDALRTVLTKDETLRLIGCLSGTQQLMAKLICWLGS